MFKKNKELKSLQIDQSHISTLVGLGYEITGDVKGLEVIRVDGQIKGNLLAEQGVVLGDKGSIIGNIQTKSAIIYGLVEGDIQAQHLEIKKSGKVKGNISTEMLEIELGAQYLGNVEMKSTNEI